MKVKYRCFVSGVGGGGVWVWCLGALGVGRLGLGVLGWVFEFQGGSGVLISG
jgi:hypothetical protein